MDSASAPRTKLDRGRLTIPAAFRKLLRGTDRVFLTNHFHGQERSLLLFTPVEWTRFEANLNGLRSNDTELQLFKTFFLGGAAELPIDMQGRVLLSAPLRKFLTSAAVLVCRPDPRWIT
jgi:division/cell wall cluster transcriptional repressor MraZ